MKVFHGCTAVIFLLALEIMGSSAAPSSKVATSTGSKGVSKGGSLTSDYVSHYERQIMRLCSESCPPGPPGNPGAPGPMGPSGQTGPAGPSGPPGPMSPQGPPGPKGPRGPTGETGPKGAKGARGEDGQSGRDGKDGKDGRRGKDGFPGLKGEPGAAGVDGKPGPVGPVGPVGSPGRQGETGSCTCDYKSLMLRPNVAFSLITSGVTEGPEETDIRIESSSIRVNVGTGNVMFKTNVMRFTAPISGIYHFFVSTQAVGNGVTLVLYKNNAVVMRVGRMSPTDITDKYTLRTNSIMLTLVQGETVTLRVQAKPANLGGFFEIFKAPTYVTFDGYLIFLMDRVDQMKLTEESNQQTIWLANLDMQLSISQNQETGQQVQETMEAENPFLLGQAEK